MRKKLCQCWPSPPLRWGLCLAFAAELGEDMDTIAQNLQVVQKTSDAGELKAALTKMRGAAVDAGKPPQSWKAKRRTVRK